MADNMGVNPFKGVGEDHQIKARTIVLEYAIDALKPDQALSLAEIFVVWYVKSLQNWKAIISTSLPDGRYYEVTYNGNQNVTYVDVYQKIDHFESFNADHREP